MTRFTERNEEGYNTCKSIADTIQSYFASYGYSITCFNLSSDSNWAMVVGPGIGTALRDLGYMPSRNPGNWGTPASSMDDAVERYGTVSRSIGC